MVVVDEPVVHAPRSVATAKNPPEPLWDGIAPGYP
jgi:hypothetical protein